MQQQSVSNPRVTAPLPVSDPSSSLYAPRVSTASSSSTTSPFVTGGINIVGNGSEERRREVYPSNTSTHPYRAENFNPTGEQYRASSGFIDNGAERGYSSNLPYPQTTTNIGTPAAYTMGVVEGSGVAPEVPVDNNYVAYNGWNDNTGGNMGSNVQMGCTDKEGNYGPVENGEGNPDEVEDDDEPEVRWNWRMFPTTQELVGVTTIPLGCMYTPLKRKMKAFSFVADRCSRCTAFLNPYAQLDIRSQTWLCPLCQESNTFSSCHDSPITEYNLPIPMQVENATVEYIESARVPPNQAYLLMVDLCLDNEQELQGLKNVLKMVVERLPSDVFVAFLTFNITLQLHNLKENKELGPRVTSLRGTEEIKPEEFNKCITNVFNYVTQLNECRQYLLSLIDDLQCDPWPVPKSHRRLRCTGAALSFASTLLELFAPSRGSAIFAFLSGPCTAGPGMVVQPSRDYIIRSHRDICEGNSNSTLWFSSCSYYDKQMRRLVFHGHALCCFCACLDQLGIGELKQCISASGGVAFNAETWLQESFYRSIELFLNPDEDGRLRFAMNATFSVLVSPTWQVSGVIGQCVGLGKPSHMASKTQIGDGQTIHWASGMIDRLTTFAVYFTITGKTTAPVSLLNSSSSAPSLLSLARGGTKDSMLPSQEPGPYRIVQFITRYELDTEVRVRVATIAHPQSHSPTKQQLIEAFDQETAAVMLAREAIFLTDNTPLLKILHWLDSKLVEIVASFGDRNSQAGRPGAPPMRLPPQCVFFPAFIYHLRRSGYLQIFNSSPDETAIIRLQFIRSNVRDSIVQIQPTLYRYRMDAPAEPVPLDSSALQPDCVVLLDTFFEVVMHSGSTIAAWRSAGYAEKEEYAYFKEFLDTCLSDAQMLVMGRLPVPRLIDACQDDPDARILYNRINPSRSYNSLPENGISADNRDQQGGELVYTDDASLEMFMSHLWKLAAAQKYHD